MIGVVGTFQLEGVVIERGGRVVLGPLDLKIPADGPVMIVGTSGSGKSSLLRLLNRLDAPAAGTVRLDGEDLAAMDVTALRRRVAMVFQKPVPLPGTVADNLRVAAPSLTDAEVVAALERVGLPGELAHRDARELSGGEGQRMALARSLATEPEVVLFDEPTSALDPDNAERIEALAQQLAGEAISVIWVTHDPDQRDRLARHVIELGDAT
jgi:putative ABC transport system ATP-binding protein